MYVATCLISTYISGLYLEEMKKNLNDVVIKRDNGCYDISKTIYKTLGLHFDNATHLRVSWNCAQCSDKISVFVTRYFKFAFGNM